MNLDILPILISLLSCVIALLSVFYARKSRDIAKQANQIALHNDLKPSRLAIYNTLRDFADYCCGYYTLQWCVKAVKGTHDLSNRIVAVKWELDSYGPLGMADVEEKAAHLQKKAWQLQQRFPLCPEPTEIRGVWQNGFANFAPLVWWRKIANELILID